MKLLQLSPVCIFRFTRCCVDLARISHEFKLLALTDLLAVGVFEEEEVLTVLLTSWEEVEKEVVEMEGVGVEEDDKEIEGFCTFNIDIVFSSLTSL